MKWLKTQYANLLRYEPTGVFFARIRVGGKLIWRSLKTTSVTVAKLKLADLEREERTRHEAATPTEDASLSFKTLLDGFLDELDRNPSLKPRTRQYWRERASALLASWPSLGSSEARKITEAECERWATRFATTAAPSNFNNTTSLLKRVLDRAVNQGLRYSNPAAKLKRTRVLPKRIQLPSQSQFAHLLSEIRRVPNGPGLACAELVEFLAYGGFRKGEAAAIRWNDIDSTRREITVRGDPETGTKNWTVRRVPMIPDMIALLDRLGRNRPDAKPDDLVMRVHECQGTLTRACSAIRIPRITHHDLRHLFATRCIEAGVDIPTVSRWLGHKDGGALAMKVYGHLRDEHSASMAQKVCFSTPTPGHA
ncbi:MAG: site-specific integrase [Verrucomicrobiales bacterium]|nr:site-specific integrase [Verrucomicrobiales bacterium]